MRKCCWIFLFVFGFTAISRAQKITPTQYIEMYKDLAIAEMKRSGVPASIKLAQGIIETQAGNSWLVINSNNHFGIKCKNNWGGESVYYDDDEKGECFRKYPSAYDSYKDHSDFLRNNPRYGFLFKYDVKDYKSWAYGLKQAGYATSKTYTQHIISTIEKYHLEDVTLEGLRDKSSYAEYAASHHIKEQPAYAVQTPGYSKPGTTTNNKPLPEPRNVTYPSHGTFEINGRKAIYVAAGSSMIQLAKEHKIRLSRLVQYNDLPNDNPPGKAMVLFLQKKNKKGKTDYHLVAKGESMHDIAQAEGIQMRWLLRRNKMKEGDEPTPGQRLALNGYASRTPELLAKGMDPDDAGDASDGFIKEITSTGKDIVQNTANNSNTDEIAGNSNQGQVQKNGTRPGPSAPRDVPAVEKRGPDPVQKTIPATSNSEPKPVSTGQQKPAQPQPGNLPAGMSYHEVVEKDTLYNISKRYNVTVAQIREWNQLPGYDIQIGQRLIIRK